VISEQQYQRVCEAIERLPRGELPGHVRGVFSAALAHADPVTGDIARSRAELARELRTHPANVSRALRTLERLDVVFPSRRARALGYALNAFAFKPAVGDPLPPLYAPL
jgi:hypothetical protein